MDFGNEAGDDVDSEELESYFVKQELFKDFENPRCKFQIALAKKGVGKSALLQWLADNFSKAEDALVIKCRGADITRSCFNLSNKIENPNEYIRDWMTRICAIINRKIAQKIGFAGTDDKITLVEDAELNGFKDKNLVGCLISRFTKLLDKIAPEKKDVKNHHEILKRLKYQKVYLLIDDLDATFQNTERERLEVSTFFSACRYLLQDIAGLYVRVTLRSDVWPIIRKYDESLDKVEQYTKEIVWEQNDFREFLFKRIHAQLIKGSFSNLCKTDGELEEEFHERIISTIFERKLHWGKKDSWTHNVIHTLSYKRPRWGIQLCKLAQKNCLRDRRSKICKVDIDAVWGEYGSKRIKDLVSEHKHQCANLVELLNAFRGEDRRLTRDELLSIIKNKIINHLDTFIEGKNQNGPIEIAHFLFRIGFIVARSEAEDEVGDGYGHYDFESQSDFLCDRTSNDFNVLWEIHPCYRQALDIKKMNKSQRAKKGIPAY